MAMIQAGLDPQATVKHDEKLKDKHGHSRQFDVVLRGKIGGHEVLGVIECKDLQGSVGTPVIDAFVTKAASVGADLKFVVSKHGFSRPALKVAADNHVHTLSLLKSPTEKHGFTVGDYVYACRLAWTSLRLSAVLTDGTTLAIHDRPQDVHVNGYSLFEWILQEAHSTFLKIPEPGWYRLRLRFHDPATIVLSSGARQIQVLEVYLKREREYRRKVAFAVGSGFVDFGSKKLKVPGGGTIKVSFTADPNLKDWEPVDALPKKPSALVLGTLFVYSRPGEVPRSLFDAQTVAEVMFDPLVTKQLPDPTQLI